MANKPRPPMTTAEEIINWAEKTREANGEAFTMLNKEEQLLMAKFILAMRDHIKKLQNGTGISEQAKPEADKPVAEQSKSEDKSTEEPPKEEREPVDANPAISKRQTNMDFFRANNVSMQRAFELYQTWADCDPDNRIVIDEKRKAYVKSAGFAFWLNLPHE